MFLSQIIKMDNSPIPIIDKKKIWKTQMDKNPPKNYNNQTSQYNEYIGGDIGKPQ